MGNNSNLEIGRLAENEARQFLENQGLLFLEKNFIATHVQSGKQIGEIDLIMREKHHYVFIEVKSRQQDDYGNPLEMVSNHKQKRIILATKYYLLQKGLWDKVYCRFDVIGFSPQNADKLIWIKNAFEIQY